MRAQPAPQGAPAAGRPGETPVGALDAALGEAARYHRSGRLDEAERAYLRVLEADPANAGALHRLGVVAHQKGDNELAAELIAKAIGLGGNDPALENDLGLVCRALGRPAEAMAHYRQALYLDPLYHLAHNNLGLALKDKGRRAEAIEHYRLAIGLRPDYAEAHYNLALAESDEREPDAAIASLRAALALAPDFAAAHVAMGVLLRRQGEHREAVASFRRALLTEPDLVEAHNDLGEALLALGEDTEAIAHYRQALVIRPAAAAHNSLGGALRAKGELDEALASFRRALEAEPQFADAHNNAGAVLLAQDKLDQALDHLDRALVQEPRHAEALNNRGNALRRLERLEESLDCYRQALAIRPDYAEAHNNMAVVFEDQGRTGEAVAAYQRALAIEPDNAEAHFDLAMARLLGGDFENGWPEYEWRWRTQGFASRRREQSAPQWRGERLEGRAIVLQCEQGLGDSLQFVRYASLVKARGAEVVVECPTLLARLFETVPGVDRVVPRGDPLPDHQCWAPLMSLPGLLGTTLETVPAEVPYLSASEADAAPFDAVLPARADGLKVGIVWAGYRGPHTDRRRPAPLDLLLTLAQVPGVALFSLQKEPPEGRPPDAGAVTDLAPLLGDFADTAAAIAKLDLVVTVDTSVAHLAGALGCVVWTVLPFPSDWRWLLDRDDSPWYPTMRLFRQRRPGDWPEVFERVVAALGDAVKGG